MKVIDIRRSFVSSSVHVASRRIDFLTASPTPCCPARPLLPSNPLQNTRYPAAANSVRPGLRVSYSPMTSQPSTLHFCKSTSAWPAPRRPATHNERTFQVATLSSPVRDRALATFCLVFALRRLSGRALLLPFLANRFFLLLILCLVHLSRYMPCLCVSPPSGFSSPTLRRPHLSPPPAYRICCLLTLIHLQSARFPRGCPETGKTPQHQS